MEAVLAPQASALAVGSHPGRFFSPEPNPDAEVEAEARFRFQVRLLFFSFFSSILHFIVLCWILESSLSLSLSLSHSLSLSLALSPSAAKALVSAEQKSLLFFLLGKKERFSPGGTQQFIDLHLTYFLNFFSSLFCTLLMLLMLLLLLMLLMLSMLTLMSLSFENWHRATWIETLRNIGWLWLGSDVYVRFWPPFRRVFKPPSS